MPRISTYLFVDVILNPSDDEFDDLDGRPDTSFESFSGLLLDARNKVKSGSVIGTGMCLEFCRLPIPSTSALLAYEGPELKT